MTKEQLKFCFDNWFDQIRNYITYRCGDTELATDITQEAFMKLWEKDLDFEKDRTKGLLYKIANDLRISHFRKKATEQKYNLSLNLKDSHNPIENELAFNETKKKYEDALKEMNEKRREVFLLSRMEGLSYKEIATILDISVKAVEKRMSLALNELKSILIHG